jgi:hypothetical protein
MSSGDDCVPRRCCQFRGLPENYEKGSQRKATASLMMGVEHYYNQTAGAGGEQARPFVSLVKVGLGEGTASVDGDASIARIRARGMRGA